MGRFVPGVLEAAVLAAIDDGGASGSRVVRQLGATELRGVRATSVYGALRRLSHKGLIDSYVDSSGGRALKVYTVNDRGRATLASFTTTWCHFADAIDELLRASRLTDGPDIDGEGRSDRKPKR